MIYKNGIADANNLWQGLERSTHLHDMQHICSPCRTTPADAPFSSPHFTNGPLLGALMQPPVGRSNSYSLNLNDNGQELAYVDLTLDADEVFKHEMSPTLPMQTDDNLPNPERTHVELSKLFTSSPKQTATSGKLYSSLLLILFPFISATISLQPHFQTGNNQTST